MPASSRSPLPKRGDEVRFAPRANSIGWIRRNIWNIKSAKRRRESKAAAKPRVVDFFRIAVRCSVTRRAAGDVKHRPAVADVRRVRRQLSRRHRRRNSQNPKQERNAGDARGRAGQDLVHCGLRIRLSRAPSEALTLLEAIILMASAAIVLTDAPKCGLERLDVLHVRTSRLGIGAKFLESRFEVVCVLPDLWAGGIRVLGGRLIIRIRRKQRGRL